MTITLFTFVDLYSRALVTLDHLLTKGVARAEELGVGEGEMLGWRLIGDMNPLGFQIMVVVNFSRWWPARVAGLAVPEGIDADLDVAGFRAAIAETRAYLGGLTAEQFAGRDDVPFTHQIGPGMEPTMPSGQWLSVFATTNIYFHLSTAYGILRANGAAIGKPDLFAGGL
ncbi:DUF1993 domain-containing protein [Sphingomonas sp. LB-2]|uniref:DUF1993 domain-containing protein n=1 Tax=Sphingomonas caeni TaxID=2984949 RepID=UPI00223253AF|nr:DUF1993 domain-containing protein [Sphingomonas caeni]MCW3849555.1 DUF1993 domain-containing protein [Sphingomonas caeni]